MGGLASTIPHMESGELFIFVPAIFALQDVSSLLCSSVSPSSEEQRETDLFV